MQGLGFSCLLGGSWVDVRRVISRITIIITNIRGLITPRPMNLQVRLRV